LVDLSNGNGSCNTTYRENRAQRLVLTAEGGLVLVGDIAVYDDDTFMSRYVATAEFNGGSYAPARPGFFCTSAGGQLWSHYSDGGGFSADGIVHAAVSDVGAHVLSVGSADPVGDSGIAQFGVQNFVDLASGASNHDYDVGMPAGYWRERQSDFWQIRTEPEPGHFVLFGDAENGTVGDNVRRVPVIATTAANTMQPLWFYPVGGAADAAIGVFDGQRLTGALDLLVLGAGRDCTASNNCVGDWDSLAVGISNGQSVLNAYQPQPAFGNDGWVRHRVPDYDGSPATHAIAWSGAIQRGISAASDTDLYVVGEFRSDTDGHLDTFVTKLRLFNGGDPPWVIPADTIFLNGFD
jgi:hypothetical protein